MSCPIFPTVLMPDIPQLECNRISLPWLLKPAILTELSSTAPQIREILKSRFFCLFFFLCIPYFYVFKISYCKYIALSIIYKENSDFFLKKYFYKLLRRCEIRKKYYCKSVIYTDLTPHNSRRSLINISMRGMPL